MFSGEVSEVEIDFTRHGSSFYDFIRVEHDYLLPRFQIAEGVTLSSLAQPPHGTTILALKYRDGVMVAADRQATEGYQIASRHIEKVYKADDYSVIAIAGAAGPCIDMVKLFQVELEHYEKLEGDVLALEGKANKLAQMVRQNLPAAFQGLIVIPILAGYDLRKSEGRIFKYDVTGGRYEEGDFYATGSGGKDARNTLKKFFRSEMTREQAMRLVLDALLDASEEDVATGGPDLVRGIYPSVKIVAQTGTSDLPEDEIRQVCELLLSERRR
jgi:proteasome beta subunit